MPSKSIFRQPGARHFQLVHRSQRDPLIHDPDASQYVLKQLERKNVKVSLAIFFSSSSNLLDHN
jgi:protein LTV1